MVIKKNNGFAEIILDNCAFQLKSSNLVTMVTTKKCIKVVFYTNNDGGNSNTFVRKLSRTTVVSITIKSYNQLNFFEFGNHGNSKHFILKLFLMLIMKVINKVLAFVKLFETTVVPMATISYNQFEFLNLVTMATTKIV